MRLEVVGRLLRKPCAQSRQVAFPRLLASRRQVVVVRRAPARLQALLQGKYILTLGVCRVSCESVSLSFSL